MLSTGRDLHTHTASLLFSIEEADVTPEQRQAAKSTNFGVPGGLGPRKLAALARRQYGLSWDVETAREMKFRWLDVFHDVAEYFKCFKVDPWELRRYGLTKRQFAEELGLATEPWPDWRELTDAMGKGKFFEVTLPTGRRSPPRRYTQAMNFFFQGLGADTITEAYLRCEAAGLAVIAVVHDSVSCEAAPDQAEEVARQLSHCMEEALAEICPNVPRAVVKSEIKSHWF
jgi:DNA polymerase I-like protein with 3'-5' exonuclease and polymerase domains